MSSDKTTELHWLFRGSAEFAKALRVLSLLFELAAAGVALHAIFSPGYEGTMWRPIGTFLLIAIATGIRSASSRYASFSERCRMRSTRAFACGRPIAAAEFFSLEGDAPPLAMRLATSLPAQDLDAYFEPTAPIGPARLREIYAHSAFYSWRLSSIAGTGYVVFGVAVVVSALLFTYGLATSASGGLTTDASLDAVYTVLLAVLGLRPIAAGVQYLLAASELKGIADSLLSNVARGKVDELANEYDRAVAMIPPPPTILYRLLRDRLQRRWLARREAL